MKTIIDLILGVFKYHKKKLLIFFVFVSIFTITIFPYDDLSDLISSQITKATNNQVYLQFERLGLGLLPTPSIKLEEVEVVTKSLPPLKAGLLKLSPSVLDLLRSKYGGSFYAKDFLKSEITGSVHISKANKEDIVLNEVELDIENLDLSELNKLIKIPVKLSGKISLELEGNLDSNYKQQPNFEFDLGSKTINVPATTIPTTYYGPITIPTITLSSAKLKGRLIDGEIILEEVQFGGPKDQLQILVKGKVGVAISKGRTGPKPKWSSYDVRTKITVSSDIEKKLFFLMALAPYKSTSGKASTFMFKAAGRSFYAPPNLSKLSAF